MIIGCTARFSFDILLPQGTVIRISLTDVEGPPVTRAEWRTFRHLIDAQLTGTGREIDWTGVERPQLKPAYSTLLGAQDDRIWVFATRPGVETTIDPQPPPGYPNTYWREPNGGLVFVFTLHGDYAGPLKLPPSIAFDPYDALTVPPVIRGDTVWAVTVDSLGTQSVTRFHVRPSLGHL